MSKKGWKDIPIGGLIAKGGTARDYRPAIGLRPSRYGMNPNVSTVYCAGYIVLIHVCWLRMAR